VANNAPHVHVGFVEDREQTKYLNYKEIKSLLTGVPSINQYTSYSPSAYNQGQVVPFPVQNQQPQMMQGGGGEMMMLSGPSEQDLLNSFYKRVLLNTV
jgi:hypothetical protein